MFNSTELFCVIDDFFFKFEATYWKFLKQSNHCLRIRKAQLSISEIIFIAIWYKCSALSNGHIADIKMVEQLVKGLQAKLYADRGYINQELKRKLKEQGIDLITYHRKNMQSVQLCASDEYHLKQRNKIETLDLFHKSKNDQIFDL